MAAIAATARLSAAPRVASRRAAVARPARALRVRASAQKEAALPVAVAAGAATMLANPLVAQAAVTPSLQNFLYSILAGGAVLAVIAGAITIVSNFDPTERSG